MVYGCMGVVVFNIKFVNNTEQYDNRTGNTLKRASFIFKGIQYHFQFVVTVISFGCNYWCKIQSHETSAFNVQLWIHLAVLSVVLHYKRIMVRGFHLSRFYACCWCVGYVIATVIARFKYVDGSMRRYVTSTENVCLSIEFSPKY